MIGICVSLYDKFDDLRLLVDIVRHNWDREYYISVCSNHPDAESRVSDIDIDQFEKGTQIKYDPSASGLRGYENLQYRVYNSFRTAVNNALSVSDVDHVMHLHADAWPLDEDKLNTIITEMEAENSAVTFPCRTEVFLRKYPPGSMEDQFVVFDAAAANEANLLERSALEFPPGFSIHDILPLLCLVKFGWGRIHHYSSSHDRRFWDGKRCVRARPMFYREPYGQVHIATEDFPGNLGKALQSHYLQKHDLTAGPAIEDHIATYGMDRERLFAELDGFLADLDDQLKWYGLSADSFNRDVRQIEEFLDCSLPLRIERRIKKGVVSVAEEFGFELDRKDEIKDAGTLHEYYDELIDPADYPDTLTEEYEANFGR